MEFVAVAVTVCVAVDVAVWYCVEANGVLVTTRVSVLLLTV